MTKLLIRFGAAIVFVLASSLSLVGQTRPLAPMPTRGLPVTPFMEGWYANEDGTFSISFGYLNRNAEDVLRIPIGESNSIEPASFSGMQPTVFLPGRHRGVFTVTVPNRDTELLWTIVNANGEAHKVPGRTASGSYELDRNPRPAGSLPPRVAFAENGPWGWDPTGIVADRVETARVGQPVTLTLYTNDPSQRDPNDPRFETAKSLRVVWSPYQSPPNGNVTFTRHESTPVISDAAGEGAGGRRPSRAGPEEIMLPNGAGVARVNATFSQPGEYLVRAQVDNWRSPDSSSGDQCCWSNAYVRVNVSP